MEYQFCPYCMSPVEDGKPCEACGLTQGSYSPSPHHLPPGTVLKDRYLVGRVLGEGGFGITYIGCDLQLELKVAIKEYFPTDKASRVAQSSLEVTNYTGPAGVNYDKGLKKFLQEARTLARMDKQPVIVNVRDFFETNHTAYIVMEYVAGTTFKELVEQRGGRIPAGELLYLIEPLFFALKEMHGNGLIHRDISPENLMIEKGAVRLLDFGCARESANGSDTLTIALKHGYAPVEQYQSKGQGPWTDVYALSATIYYCLTGKKPPQAMDRLVEDELIPPRKLGVDLTQQQEAALLRGMTVPPKRRFQSMEEFHTALYEGCAPKPADEPVDETVEAPEGQAAPDAGPDTTEAAADTGDRTVEATQTAEEPNSFHLAEWLKKNKLLAGGIAAALALVILLSAVLPRVLGPGHGEEPSPSQSEEPTQTQEPSADPGPSSTAPAVESITASSVNSLLSQLEDDAVASVVVPEGIWLNLNRPVTLTKPLRVEANAGVMFLASLTVAQGGRLEVEGSVDGTVLLRTVDGGTVSVGAGGHLGGGGLLWLEREDDLTCEPNGEVDIWARIDPTKEEISDPWAQSHYLVLDRDALFADAVPVTSEEEFLQHCQGEKPIVIDGDITLTHYREASVPILVSEGSTFTAPIDGDDCTLDLVRGGMLFNDGTVRGRISLLGNYDAPASVCRFLNFGQAELCLNCYGGPSTLLNQGEFTFTAGLGVEPMLGELALSNMGQITIGPGVSVTKQGNWSQNGGTITLSGGSFTLQENTGFNNWGTIALENGARLVVNNNDLYSRDGTITVSDDSAIEGSGKIQGYDDPGDSRETININGQDVPLNTTYLDLGGRDITGISALAGLTELRELYLRHNPISDVSALAGLSGLKTLDLLGTQVTDLSPLRGLTEVEALFLDGTPVSDISALSGMTAMDQLHLDNTKVVDISALSGMTRMRELTLCCAPVRDISVVRNMPDLKNLYIDGTQVTDLTPAYELQLELLKVHRGQFTQQQLDALTATQPAGFQIETVS